MLKICCYEIPVNVDDKCTDAFKYGGTRYFNIIMCQLRNRESQLNSDLYKDHLSNSPSCICGYSTEDVDQFFLFCPRYAVQRQSLLTSLSHLQLDIQLNLHLNLDLNLSQHLHMNVDILTKGSNHLSHEINSNLCACVQTFIKSSGRL